MDKYIMSQSEWRSIRDTVREEIYLINDGTEEPDTLMHILCALRDSNIIDSFIIERDLSDEITRITIFGVDVIPDNPIVHIDAYSI